MTDDETPNQHALAEEITMRDILPCVRIAEEDYRKLLHELKLLREQVTNLQADQTAQLKLARSGAFNFAAHMCSEMAESYAEHIDEGFISTGLYRFEDVLGDLAKEAVK